MYSKYFSAGRRVLILVLLAAVPLGLHSLEAGAAEVQVQNVAQGSATVSQDQNNTVIEAANNTIINYTRFDVNLGQTATFIQPNARSRVLNRVLSTDPSYLLGTLNANGQIYFVNPSGLVIGQDAVINTAQFHAAAGNISDTDFLAGIDRFVTSGGVLLNEGTISALEGVTLIGNKVLNRGTILSDRGLVALCSSDEVYLAEEGSGVKVRVDNLDAGTGQGAGGAGLGSEEAGVLNAGTVGGEEVLFACGDVYSLAVVNAGRITSAGGKVTMSGNGQVRNEGVVDVSDTSNGGRGGSVKMLGETVVMAGAEIDASGDAGGGTVLIGGNYQGKGEERNSSLTFVDGESNIAADAGSSGDGGEVIVWSDDRTGFYGNLSARGSDDGSGGFAEVSGVEQLSFNGSADLTGGAGAGILLLDPTNIIVEELGGAAYTDVNTFSAGGVDETVDPDTLDAVVGNVSLQAKNDITVNDALTLNTEDYNLTMRAGNDITIDAAVTTTDGRIVLTANDALGTQTGSGSIFINASLSTTGNAADGDNITLNIDGGTGSVQLDAPLDQGAGLLSGDAETVFVMSPSASIQDGIDIVNGSTVYVIGGAGSVTYDEELTIVKSLDLIGREDTATDAWSAGTAGASSDAPIIQSSTGPVISVLSDNVTIQGIVIDVTQGSARKGILALTGANDLTISYCSFDYDNTADGGEVGDLAITFNPDDTNNVFERTTISWNDFNTTAGTDSWGVLVGNAEDLEISNNRFDTGIKFDVGGGNADSENILVTANTFDVFDSPGILFIRDGGGEITGGLEITQNLFDDRSVGIYFFATGDAGADDFADSLQAGNFGEAILINENNFDDFDPGNPALQVSDENDPVTLATKIDARNNWWDDADGPTEPDNKLNPGSQGAEISNNGDAVIVYAPWWRNIAGAPGTYTGDSLSPILNVRLDTAYASFTDALGDASLLAGDELQATPGPYDEVVNIDEDVTVTVTETGLTGDDQIWATANSWASPGGTSIGLGGNFATDGTGGFDFDGDVALTAEVMLDSAGENIAFTNLAGSHNLTLAEGIGAGATTFTGTVSNLGSGSGAALTIEESVTGLVDFQGSLATNSGITATDTNVQIKMDGPTTLGDGNTGTVINGDLTLGPNCTLLSTFDGLFVDELIVAAGANPLSLASNNNSSTFVSAVDFGGRDLTITSGGTTFQGSVSNLGDGTGASLNVAAGAADLTHFEDTVAANSGFTTADGTNIRLDQNVTITGGDTATFILGNSVFDGMTFTMDGPVTIGDDGSDTLLIATTGVTLQVADEDVSFGAVVDGSVALTVDAGTGAVSFDSNIGAIVPFSDLTVTGGEITTASTATVTANNSVSMTASTGDINLGNSVTAGTGVTLSAASGDLVQTGGTVSGLTVDLDSAGGIYGALDLVAAGLDPGDPPVGWDNQNFVISTSQIDADVTGAGKINLENSYGGIVTINSLTTVGSYVNFSNTTSGPLTVGGTGVSSGNGGTDGGNINIISVGNVTLNALVTSSAGAGGVVTIGSGVTNNVAPVAGAGDILIAGDTQDDLYIITAMVSGSTINLTADQDIFVLSDLVTYNPSASINLTADSDDNGVGGVVVEPQGFVSSAGDVTMVGSDVFATATPDDSIVVRADGTNSQIMAEGSIILSSSTAPAAPDEAVIQILGRLEATEDGIVSVLPSGVVELDGSALGAAELISATGGVGGLLFLTPVVLTGDTSLSSVYQGSGAVADGDINFQDMLDGGFALTLAAGTGNVSINHDVGSSERLGALAIDSATNVSAPRRTLEAGENPLDFDDYDANDNTVGVRITAASFTHTSGTGTTDISGNLDTSGLVGEDGGNVDIQTTDAITIARSVDASGGDAGGGAGRHGGSVTLISTDGAVTVGAINTSGSDADASPGGDAGDVLLQVNPEVTLADVVGDDYIPTETLVLTGDITALGGAGFGGDPDGTGGTVSLSADGRANVPAMATISSAPTGNDVRINALHILTGQNEKFTVAKTDPGADEPADGNLELISPDGTITVGDLSASNNIMVDAGTGTVTLLLRPAAPIVSSSGFFVSDMGMDIVAGNALTMTAGNFVLGGIDPTSPSVAGKTLNLSLAFFDAHMVDVNRVVLSGDFDPLVLSGTTVLDARVTQTGVTAAITPDEISELIPRPDADGVPGERAASMAEQFRAADRNGDGFLTYEEFLGMLGVQNMNDAYRLFSLIDLNGDGMVSLEELEEYLRRRAASGR